MGKCDCSTKRIQKNRYNPCTNKTEASEQYYNKDQILAMVQEIIANKGTVVGDITNILNQDIASLSEILQNVSTKEDYIQTLLQNFLENKYGDTFTEINNYISNLESGDAQYDPNIIQEYINTINNIPDGEAPWKQELLDILNGLMPSSEEEAPQMIYVIDNGIKNVTYRWGFGTISTQPTSWYTSEETVNLSRNSHLGEWIWTEQTISFEDSSKEDLITYSKEYIPDPEISYTITKEYQAFEDLSVGIEDFDDTYDSIEVALQNASSEDNYVFCHTIWENTGTSETEEEAHVVMSIVRDSSGNPVIYSSDPTWVWNETTQQWETIQNEYITKSEIYSIVEYYQSLIGASTDESEIKLLTSYISLLRDLYTGNLDWTTAVYNYSSLFENESGTGLIDDLRNRLPDMEEGALKETIGNFIAWYEVVKGYTGVIQETDNLISNIETKIVFEDEDWVTKDVFDSGIQKVLNAINSVGEKEKDCSCKSPIELLREEITALKSSIANLTQSLNYNTSVGTTDVPYYVAIPYLRIPTYDNIKADCGPGWFPLTPVEFGTQIDATTLINKWKEAYGNDIVITMYQRNSKFYVRISRYKDFTFPFTSSSGKFSINPANETILSGFSGNSSVTLTENNIPAHCHSKIVTNNQGRVITQESITIKGGAHSHDVEWGTYNSEGGGYYGARTGGSSNFPSYVDNDAPNTRRWYGQGNSTSTPGGFVQKNTSHSHFLLLPIFGSTTPSPIAIDPKGYYTAYLVRLPVPEGTQM